MGHPITKFTKEKILEIKEDLENYINETPIPIVSEFAYTRDIRRATLYEIPELAYTLKRLIEKKETQLEKLALGGKINTTFAIFSLKQLGWSDKQEIDMTANVSGTALLSPEIKEMLNDYRQERTVKPDN